MTINLEKIRVMSEENFNNLQELQDEELYFVEFNNYMKNVIKSALSLSLTSRANTNITNANRTYTIPADGTVIGTISIGKNTSPIVNLTRDNQVYPIYKFQGAVDEVVTNEINIPVLQGDILTVTGGTLNNGCTYVYFYPFIIEV